MTDVSAPTWDKVRDAVARALAGLSDGAFVVIGEPEPVRTRHAGLRGLLGGRAAPTPTRFVQVRRDGDWFGAECVGAQSFGGPYPVDAATDARLRALGWSAPGDAGYESMGGPAYRHEEPVTAATAVAALLVASLGSLGLDPSGPLELTGGH
ncbi:TY-Chap domain-containing protein [Cellulomonas soli]|uniref:TY-Chap N-terminal domain-containing protein n=1 Tax=Cellulomonas soli TaxID=931535 RepID=A0A512PDW8_9CELL|nr:hypothetical protein [Cellulomonas soli]NYI59111.1 hypothetical protein [Cellulomonas soli]GEP69398.1 hypothetical protein CSO01_21130 [Cellulomonas soli]